MIVAAAAGSVATGEDCKQTNSTTEDDDMVDSFQLKLYNSYHGNLINGNSGDVSFVDDFCTCRGLIFSRLIDKGYVDEHSHNDTKTYKLKLDHIIHGGENQYLLLDENVRKQLHLATLKGSNVIKSHSLMQYKRNNTADVKRICKLAKLFCKNDTEDLPSGKQIQDMFKFIFCESWNEEQSKKVDKKDDDSEDSGNESAPSNSETKTPSNGWAPKGWLVYYMFVSKHTRITDEFTNDFLYDGFTLDTKKRGRTQERMEQAEQRALKRKADTERGIERGQSMDIHQKQVHINLQLYNVQMQSMQEKRNNLTEQIQLVKDLRGQELELVKTLYGSNRSEMIESDEWKGILDHNKKINELLKEITEVSNNIKTFEDTNPYMNEAKQLNLNISNQMQVGSTQVQLTTPSRVAFHPPVQNISTTRSTIDTTTRGGETPISNLTQQED